jgi:hypothetical protein
MERDDAIRKIRRLIAVADSPTAPGPERESARDMAAKMRERHGITDGDLADPDDELLASFFGERLFYYHSTVMPRLASIQREIALVVADLNKAGPEQRAWMLTKFYRDLRGQLEGVAYGVPGLRVERDRAIKAYYWAYIEREMTSDEEWAKERGRAPYYDRNDPQLHSRAVTYLRMATDMRTKDLERIVGRTESELWELEHRKHVCVACGLDGLEGREMPGYYEFPEGQDDVDVTWRKRHWVHPSCRSCRTQEGLRDGSS